MHLVFRIDRCIVGTFLMYVLLTICDTIKSFSQHYVTKFGRDLRRSVVFSWYPEHLGLPPDFGFAHHFSVCVVFHIFFV
jgi:hypothetical protein